MGVPMRLAPYTGVYGLSFVFATMSVALALAMLRRPRWQLAWLLPLPLLILLPRLPDFQPGKQVAVLAQPNISETVEWTPQSLEKMEQSLVLFSQETALGRRSVPAQLLACA